MPEVSFGIRIRYDSKCAESATRLEQLGFDFVGTGEHVMRGDSPIPDPLALPVLAVAAGATKKIRLASVVTLVPLYNPVILAKEVTTLDHASGGRLTLGVGIGGEFPIEFDVCGVPYKQRGKRTNESLELMKRLWAEEKLAFQGQFYQYEKVTLLPQPLQKPHPPIWIAGRKEAAMRRAAKYGDGWFPYLYSFERYQDSLKKVRSYAQEYGRDPLSIDPCVHLFAYINEDKDQARKTAAAYLGRRYKYSGDFLNVVDRYCIAGPREEFLSKLKQYMELGVKHVFLDCACEETEVESQEELLATEIIPQLKGN